MIMLVQESTRFLPDVQGHPNIVPALREIVIGMVLVLFLRARDILVELGLSKLSNERVRKLSNERVRKLSRGQKRLVEFARIRMAGPRLVILDEPMGA